MDPKKIYPRSADRETVYLKNVVQDRCRRFYDLQ